METTIRFELSGVTLVGRGTRGDHGALIPRNLGAASSEAGLFLDDLPSGTALELRTANHVYLLRRGARGVAELSGHPKYCPQPVAVALRGSRWLDSSLKKCYVAPGMQLQFVDRQGRSILTSPIERVTVLE